MNAEAQLRTRHVDTSTAVVPGQQGRMHNPFFCEEGAGLADLLISRGRFSGGHNLLRKKPYQQNIC